MHKDSPYYELADLKGKLVSVPFGSAAHGMMLKAMQDRGWPPDFWNLVSQCPEVGTTNLQEKRIDAHGDFVPFAELLPYRGFARKIFDGAETKVPTFHGVVVRKDFAEKYPEIVVAYIKALMEANDWVRKNPKPAAEKIEEWTKIEKEVVYIFLGPGGIHTLDPTIKPRWVDTIGANYGVLQKLNRVKPFNINAWVNETYVRQAFKELELDYDEQQALVRHLRHHGQGPGLQGAGRRTRRKPARSGSQGGDIVPFSSPACTLPGVNKYERRRQEARRRLPVRPGARHQAVRRQGLLRDRRQDPKKPEIVPFLLKKDAEAHAAKIGGKLATYAEALGAVSVGQEPDGTMEALKIVAVPMVETAPASRRRGAAGSCRGTCRIAPVTARSAAPALEPRRTAARSARGCWRGHARAAHTLLLGCVSIGGAAPVLVSRHAIQARLLHPLQQHPDAGRGAQKLVAGQPSTKFLTNIGISVRRILIGFGDRDAARRAAGPAHRPLPARCATCFCR